MSVYYKSVPGNANENPSFRETISEFNEEFPHFFNVITYDSGTSSTAPARLIRSFDGNSLISVEKNYKGDSIFELRDKNYFLIFALPDHWSLGLMDQCLRLER